MYQLNLRFYIYVGTYLQLFTDLSCVFLISSYQQIPNQPAPKSFGFSFLILLFFHLDKTIINAKGLRGQPNDAKFKSKKAAFAEPSQSNKWCYTTGSLKNHNIFWDFTVSTHMFMLIAMLLYSRAAQLAKITKHFLQKA